MDVSYWQAVMKAGPILVVDDNPVCLAAMRKILGDEYRLEFARRGEEALGLARRNQPQLILLDLEMPEMDGMAVCRALKGDVATAGIPVIFVTAHDGVEHETLGLETGAVDYLAKPVSPPVVRARVRNHLSLVRAVSLQESYRDAMSMLGEAGHFRDNDTGMHTRRMADYAVALARAAGWSVEDGETLRLAAPMHDVGKLGIPDAILLKPGPLDDHEWAVMQTHCRIGHDILARSRAPVFRMAAAIALHHHEKWNGSGYPQQLAGTDIPEVARIVAVADVFDALTTRRPYKEPWPVEQAMAALRQESGRHFEPRLLALFEQQLPALLEIRARWARVEAACALPAAGGHA